MVSERSAPFTGPAMEDPAGNAFRMGNPEYGSDLIVEILNAVGIEYVAMNPGSTFRGIHDSIVNYAGNRAPKLILALHEAVAVGLAHGFHKVSGRPMAVALHDIVGLGNAPTAIYEAWCDRVPMVIMGGTGPMDAALRRPGNDWIHTALIQGNLIRDFVKWDDQPYSIEAIPESLLRAWRTAVTKPAGPVYVCFDVVIQEDRIQKPIPIPDVARFQPPSPMWADPNAVEEAARLLVDAEFPVMLSGRVCRDQESLDGLVELAELVAAPVFPIYRNGLNFPTMHPLNFMGYVDRLVPEADVVLGAEPLDYAHVMRRFPTRDIGKAEFIASEDAKVISVGLDDLALRSWACEFQSLDPVDVPIQADTAVALHQIAEKVRNLLDREAVERIDARRERLASLQEERLAASQKRVDANWDNFPISLGRLSTELRDAVAGEDIVLLKNRFWVPGVWDLDRVDQYLGEACGGTMGYGPPAMVGAALALKGSGRFPVGITGDGDFNYTASALWTAAHYEIPMLMVIFNNRSYYSDVEFQENIAETRGRPLENRQIGHAIDSPPVDVAGLARSYGCKGYGPVTDPGELATVFHRAVSDVKGGSTVVVDVLVEPR